MMTAEVGVAVALGALILSVAAFFIGRQNGAKKQGVKEGTIMTELRHVVGGIGRIEANQESLVKEQKEVRERLVRVEESAKQAHKRLDTLGVVHAGTLS